MNKIILIGNLTHDPELRTTTSGVSVCSFDIAVNRKFSSQNGEKVTDFFRISVWRQHGENCARYLSKGKKVAVTGELQPRTYEARDGSTRMSLEVTADEVEFLTPKNAQEGGSEQNRYSPMPAPTANIGSAESNSGIPEGFVEVDDELPF